MYIYVYTYKFICTFICIHYYDKTNLNDNYIKDIMIFKVRVKVNNFLSFLKLLQLFDIQLYSMQILLHNFTHF